MYPWRDAHPAQTQFYSKHLFPMEGGSHFGEADHSNVYINKTFFCNEF